MNNEQKKKRLGVVGAGVVGLSTAVQLQSAFPGASVTIVADRFSEDTTSHGAAGIFRPTLGKTPGVPIDRLKKWLRNSWDHYHLVAHSKEAGRAGIEIISGYQFVNDPEPNLLEQEILYSYRPLNDKEKTIFPGDRYKYGWFATTFVVEPVKYLPYLTQQFLKQGGYILKQKLVSFEELVGQFDVIVNCTGLGSKRLLDDAKLIPNRGHVLKVRAPWLKHFVYTGSEGLCYIIPGLEYATIGGTRTDNDTDLSPRSQDTKIILAEAYKVLPSLEEAEIVYEWVGLRPHREPLRVETETLEFPSGSVQIVHNYGHGAEGISLSWGTSMDAVELVNNLLTS